MKLLQATYESLQNSVAKIYETSDLAESLKSQASKDTALAEIMRDFFNDDEEQCAEYVRQNSIVRTSIIASIEVHSADLTASFDADEELSEDDAREYVQDNFSFSYVDTHDHASIDVESVELLFTYEMRDFQTLSLAA